MFKITIFLMSTILFINNAHSETLVYRGSAFENRFEKKEPDSLNFRGEQSQKEYENKYSLPNIKNDTNINDKNVIGNYSLSNIPEIESNISINNNGTFFWYMKYKKTSLETTGNWIYVDKNNSIISLTTDPMPGDIGFNFQKTNDVGNRLPSLMAMGSYEFYIGYEPKSDFDKKGPLKNVTITCAGPYGLVTTKTDDKGFAVCTRAGYPLKFLKIKAPEIQNETTFVNPKFQGFSWNFSMDYERAHTGYAFYKEKMQIVDGKLLWDGSSLGANQKWEYLK